MEKMKQIFFFLLLIVSTIYSQTDTISRPAPYTGTVYSTWQLGQDGDPKWVKIFSDTTSLDPDGYPITKVIRRSGAVKDTIALQSLSTVVYPQAFGANNSTSIQAAVNSLSKGTVNLGNYIYQSTATITLKDSVNIVGDNFTIWTADSIINIFTAINKKDILVSGGKLIGGKRKRYAPNEGSQRKKGNGFLLDNTKFVTIDNMRVYDFQNGVMDDNSEFLTVNNSYFHNRQDSAFTCLQLRGTAYSYIYNNNMIDSAKWGTNGSTINAVYWYPGEQANINNTIEKNYCYGFGYENSDVAFPYGGGYETMILVGGSWNIINNTFEKGMRAIDIATYPYGSIRVWNTSVIDNKFKGVIQWCIKMEKNEIGVPSNFQQRYDLISLNKADSCRGFISLNDSTSYVSVVQNTARKTYGGWNPTAGTRDATVLITDANHHIIFNENIIDSSAFGGVAAYNVRDCIFSENIITNSGLNSKLDWGDGLKIYSGNTGLRKNKRNKISNNTVINSLEHGIYVNESEATILEGNHSYSNGRYAPGFYAGIVLGESNYPIAVMNIAAGQDYGMVVNNLSGQYLQFNTFYSNTETNDYYSTSGVAAYGKYNAGTDSVKGGYAKFTGYDATGTYAIKHGTTPATAGAVRLGWGGAVVFRDSANTANHYALSTGVYGNAGQLTVGSNTVGTKIRLYPGSSNFVDILNNGDLEGNGNIHLIDNTKAIKMAGAILLDKRTLNLSTVNLVSPQFKMDGTQVLTVRQAAISDAASGLTADLTYDQTEVDMINGYKTTINLILAMLRTHGIIAP